MTLPADATFVGRTAAWMHGLDVQPADPFQVAGPTLQSRTNVDAHRSDVSAERVAIRGLFASSLHRTLLDLSAWSPLVDALIVIDMALQMDLVDMDSVRRYAVGHTGAAQLRQLIEIAAPAESPMETRLRWLLLSAGLPKPEVQRDLYDDSGQFLGRADLYYASARLVIEFDGRNHQDRLVSDLRRQNALLAAGFKILRFTSADVYARPNDIVALVQAALDKPSQPLVTSAVHRIV